MLMRVMSTSSPYDGKIEAEHWAPQQASLNFVHSFILFLTFNVLDYISKNESLQFTLALRRKKAFPFQHSSQVGLSLLIYIETILAELEAISSMS